MRRVLVIAVAALGCAALIPALAGRSSGATSAAGPTYNKDVAPILDAKCASCHRLGGIAPFSLTTARDAKAHASGIVRMTKAGLMPPWMPGPDSAAFVGRDTRRLTTEEIDTLARWVSAGAPAGNAADRHSKPVSGAGLTGPGRTLTLSPARPYVPHATSGLDDYHCFLLDPKLAADSYMTGALIQPGRTGIVHHVILFEAAGAQATAADALNAQSGGKGWTCFGGPGLPLDLAGNDSLLRLGQPPWLSAWVPGHVTNSLPSGKAMVLHKGAKIVMQVHYNLIAAGGGPDRSKVVLRLRPKTTPLTELQTMLIAAPVELPCPSGTTGPACSRTQALSTLGVKYGAFSAALPTALLRLCGKTLADYPQDVGAGTSIATGCDLPAERAMTVYGVGAHMHLRGRDIRVLLNPGTPTEQTLLHIPAWDFHWQDVYFLQHPVTVQVGDHIGVRCTFDNSRAAQPVVGAAQLAPRYVVWGEGTTDEMCLGLVVVATG